MTMERERERAWLEENVFVRKGGWCCGCMSLTCCLYLALFFKVCMTVSMLSDSAEATEDWRAWTEDSIPSFLELPLALVLFLGAATRELTLIYVFLVGQAYFLPAMITEFMVGIPEDVYTTNGVTTIERRFSNRLCSCLLQMYLVWTAYRLYRGGTEHRTVKRSREEEWQYSTLCCRRYRFQGPTCCGGPLSCYLSVWAGISWSGLYVYVRENWSIKDPQIWAASVFMVCQLVWSAGLVLYLRSAMKLQRWDGQIEQYVPVRAHMWSTQRQKRWLLGAVYVHFLVNVAFLINVAIGALKLSVPETKYTTYQDFLGDLGASLLGFLVVFLFFFHVLFSLHRHYEWLKQRATVEEGQQDDNALPAAAFERIESGKKYTKLGAGGAPAEKEMTRLPGKC